MTGTRKAAGLLTTPFAELHAQFSPDGRWLALTTNESGREDVLRAEFPRCWHSAFGVERRWQLSAMEQRWSNTVLSRARWLADVDSHSDRWFRGRTRRAGLRDEAGGPARCASLPVRCRIRWPRPGVDPSVRGSRRRDAHADDELGVGAATVIVPFGSTGDWNETFQIVEPVQHNIEMSDRRLGWPFDENEPAVWPDVVRRPGDIHIRTREQQSRWRRAEVGPCFDVNDHPLRAVAIEDFFPVVRPHGLFTASIRDLPLTTSSVRGR